MLSPPRAWQGNPKRLSWDREAIPKTVFLFPCRQPAQGRAGQIQNRRSPGFCSSAPSLPKAKRASFKTVFLFLPLPAQGGAGRTQNPLLAQGRPNPKPCFCSPAPAGQAIPKTVLLFLCLLPCLPRAGPVGPKTVFLLFCSLPAQGRQAGQIHNRGQA